MNQLTRPLKPEEVIMASFVIFTFVAASAAMYWQFDHDVSNSLAWTSVLVAILGLLAVIAVNLRSHSASTVSPDSKRWWNRFLSISIGALSLLLLATIIFGDLKFVDVLGYIALTISGNTALFSLRH